MKYELISSANEKSVASCFSEAWVLPMPSVSTTRMRVTPPPFLGRSITLFHIHRLSGWWFRGRVGGGMCLSVLLEEGGGREGEMTVGGS